MKSSAICYRLFGLFWFPVMKCKGDAVFLVCNKISCHSKILVSITDTSPCEFPHFRERTFFNDIQAISSLFCNNQMIVFPTVRSIRNLAFRIRFQHRLTTSSCLIHHYGDLAIKHLHISLLPRPVKALFSPDLMTTLTQLVCFVISSSVFII